MILYKGTDIDNNTVKAITDFMREWYEETGECCKPSDIIENFLEDD